VYKARPSTEVMNEIHIYDAYLPKLMSEVELSVLIGNIIKVLEKPNIGFIMKALKESKSQYDGKMASKIANNLLKGNK